MTTTELKRIAPQVYNDHRDTLEDLHKQLKKWQAKFDIENISDLRTSRTSRKCGELRRLIRNETQRFHMIKKNLRP